MGSSAGKSESDLEPASMADALFSGTRRKVLGLLFGQPERSYSLSELIRLIGAGSGAVQREVQRLGDSGLLIVDSVGRQKWFQANPHSPIFEELCAIARKILGPEIVIQEALDTLDDRLKLAVLFGSVAKTTDRADSDIDLLLVAEDVTLEEVFSALAPAEKALGRPINPTLYTPAEFDQRRQMSNPFVASVLANRHIVLTGDLDD